MPKSRYRKLRAIWRLIRRRTRGLRRICFTIFSIVLVASRIIELVMRILSNLLA